MTDFLLAFGVYISIAGFIFGLSKKLQEVLTDEVGANLKEAIHTRHLSSFSQNWYTNATRAFDKIFGFKIVKGIHVAKFRRVFLWALSLSIFITITTELIYELVREEYRAPMWIGLLHEGLFFHGSLSFAFVAPILFISILLVDYINIAKSRTVIKFTYGVGTRRVIPLIAADFLMTFAISAVVTLAISFVWAVVASEVFEYISYKYYMLRDGEIIDSDDVDIYYQYGNTLGLIITPLIYSFLTSSLIFLIYLFTALIILLMRLTYHIDRLKLVSTRLLQWEQKPVLASGVLAIAVFTIFYVPTIALVSLFLWV